MLNTILLQAAAPAGGLGSWTMPIMFGLMFVVMYFFMIRPQSQKAKAQKKYWEELKKGDKVVTVGGIYGKIADVGDTFIMLDTENGGKLKMKKSSVSMDESKTLNT